MQKDLAALSGGGGAVTKLFDSTVSGSDAATIDTLAGGIPSGYAFLQIFASTRTSNTGGIDGIYVRVNNDSGANYDWERFRTVGAGTSMTTSGSAATNGWLFDCACSDDTANQFGLMRMTIPFYDNIINRKIAEWTDNMVDPVTSNNVLGVYGGTWRSTSAISRISFVPAFGGNIKVGSRVVIFGGA